MSGTFKVVYRTYVRVLQGLGFVSLGLRAS